MKLSQIYRGRRLINEGHFDIVKFLTTFALTATALQLQRLESQRPTTRTQTLSETVPQFTFTEGVLIPLKMVALPPAIFHA